MKQRLFVVLGLVVFLCSGQAHAVARYLVEDSSNVIKAYTEDDSLIAPPGHTAVDASVIEAAYSRHDLPGRDLGRDDLYSPDRNRCAAGHFDRARNGQGIVPCHAGCVRASTGLHPSSTGSFGRMHARAIAVEGIHWQIINSARVALNSTTRTARQPSEVLRGIGELAGCYVNGNVREYVDAIAAANSLTTPTKDWSWVNPENDPYTRVEVGHCRSCNSAPPPMWRMRQAARS